MNAPAGTSAPSAATGTQTIAPNMSLCFPPGADFPKDAFPELYPLSDHRYDIQNPTNRSSGRHQTRKNLFSRPIDPSSIKGVVAESVKEQRPAGVTTAKFNDVNMANLVGYKDQYYKLEALENPTRAKKHNIVNNVMANPEPLRPAVEVPKNNDPQSSTFGKVMNTKAGEFRLGY
ncbi:unnamed protein product [Amoebophrya sp. A25]|nr:unnamed protein product [Amoebophrya sp. A25]|eukprot:GSA25T00025422001.1